jgi:AraC family transcriptional regulator
MDASALLYEASAVVCLEGAAYMHATLSAKGHTLRYSEDHGIGVKETRFPPGLSIERHTHSTAYLCWTLAGSAIDSIESRDFAAAPGYTYYMPAATSHANRFGSVGARCLLMELQPSAVEYLEDASVDVTTPWARFGGENLWRGLAMYSKLRHGTASSLDVEELVLRAFAPRDRVRPRRSKAPGWLSRTRELLDAALPRPPRLAALAREADVHPMHFVRVFRAHVGCSPGEYVQARRIAQACRLLLDSELSLTRIGVGQGYYDQSHFTRAFTSRVGVPPGAYRQAARAQSRGALPQS